ncbi:MAG: TolC family protein [Magnetococcales bacterium]|nr:TolC family protein [Magnetococcales bacterium]
MPANITKSLCAVVLLIGTQGCTVVPVPIPVQERVSTAIADRHAMFTAQKPIVAPLTLSEAMARAIAYNLDHRLKLMEGVLASNQLTSARMELLPRLAASAGYINRSNLNASSSRTLLTGRDSSEPSISSDRSQETADLALSWNILDFGVSYYQAKQESDRLLITRERRRKVVHNLMREVRLAYWQAASAERVQSQLIVVMKQAETALKSARLIEEERLGAPLAALRYRRSLLEIIRQLEELSAEMSLARITLSALINVEPGTPFTLAGADESPTPVILPDLDLEQLENLALSQRPELREKDYEVRINATEVKKTLVRMLPGLELNLSGNYDGNSFLVNQGWTQAGLRVAFNLFNLFTVSDKVAVVETQGVVTRTQRMALTMAVLSQVHIAWQQYHAALRQFEHAEELFDVNRQMLTHMINRGKVDMQHGLEEIRSSVNTITALLQRDQSHARCQEAMGRLITALGVDPLPETIESNDLESLTRMIETMMVQWEKEGFALQEGVVLDTSPTVSSASPVVDPSEFLGEAKEIQPGLHGQSETVDLPEEPGLHDQSETVDLPKEGVKTDSEIASDQHERLETFDPLEESVKTDSERPLEQQDSTENVADESSVEWVAVDTAVEAVEADHPVEDVVVEPSVAEVAVTLPVAEGVENDPVEDGNGMKSGYVIQAGAYTRMRDARMWETRLIDKGYAPTIHTVQNSAGESWHFLYIKRFEGFSKARNFLKDFTRKENMDAFIHPLGP